MHPTHMQWFVFVALLGLCFWLLVVVRETRHNKTALQDPVWWFWVTLGAGVLVGVVPYLLLHLFGVL